MKKIIITAILLMGMTSAVDAFDNNRKGFVVGVGGGAHYTSLEYSAVSDLTKKGVATSFRIGGGLNENVMLYYMREAAWYSIESDTYVSGMSGIGMNYYFKPTTNIAYFIAGIGVGDYTRVTNGKSSVTGEGAVLGLGYEFRKRVSIEGKVMSTDVSSLGNNLQSLSSMITVNYLWY